MAGGRPPIYDNQENLEIQINLYFSLPDCDMTITGLCLFCGFESRQSFYDYEKNDEFSYIIKKARLRIENGYEKDLRGDKPTGAIFALKNMGWQDKSEQTINLPQMKQVVINVEGE